MSILYIMCMLIYFLKEKGSIHIVQSARCLFILFCVFYNLYIYVVWLTIYHDILCYHSFLPFCCSFFHLFFYHEEIYLSKEKQCYLFVMLLCKYKSSTSCKLHSLSCKNLLCFLSNLYHRCLCHTYVNACLGCVFIYWKYINHFMYRSVSGLFTTIITDQRDSLNGFALSLFYFFLKDNIVSFATQQ